MLIKRPNKMTSILIVVALALLLVGLTVKWLQKQPKATSGQIKVINSNSSAAPSATHNKEAAPSNQSQSTSSDKSSTAGSQSSSSSDLISPYGSLVSNHRPGQNGSNFVESSQCTTSPGAKCYIKFTQGDVVKTLPEKVVDNSGSVFWDWNVKDAGLTSGDWTVTAVATLDDQSKSTKDQMALEIQ